MYEFLAKLCADLNAASSLPPGEQYRVGPYSRPEYGSILNPLSENPNEFLTVRRNVGRGSSYAISSEVGGYAIVREDEIPRVAKQLATLRQAGKGK
jgi:hypothetical protein